MAATHLGFSLAQFDNRLVPVSRVSSAASGLHVGLPGRLADMVVLRLGSGAVWGPSGS